MEFACYMGRLMEACDEFMESLPGGDAMRAKQECVDAVSRDKAVETLAVMCAADGSPGRSEFQDRAGN